MGDLVQEQISLSKMFRSKNNKRLNKKRREKKIKAAFAAKSAAENTWSGRGDQPGSEELQPAIGAHIIIPESQEPKDIESFYSSYRKIVDCSKIFLTQNNKRVNKKRRMRIKAALAAKVAAEYAAQATSDVQIQAVPATGDVEKTLPRLADAAAEQPISEELLQRTTTDAHSKVSEVSDDQELVSGDIDLDSFKDLDHLLNDEQRATLDRLDPVGCFYMRRSIFRQRDNRDELQEKPERTSSVVVTAEPSAQVVSSRETHSETNPVQAASSGVDVEKTQPRIADAAAAEQPAPEEELRLALDAHTNFESYTCGDIETFLDAKELGTLLARSNV